MIDPDEARQTAAEELRFNIGTLPHLGSGKYSEDAEAYVFSIRISYPRLPDNPRDPDSSVEFDPSRWIGEIVVDGTSGEIRRRTPLDILEKRVAEIKNRDRT